MMRLLIPTVPDDVHAICVAAAISQLGGEVSFSIGPDIPCRQTLSVRADRHNDFKIVRDDAATGNSHAVDVVWLRRAKMFVLPELHADDVAFARAEFEKFIFGFWDISFPSARWINPWRARFFGENKVIQCAAARDVGFALAPTLFSNDPVAIAGFVADHGAQHVIYKSHNVIVWDDDASAVSTIRVSDIDMSDPDSLRNCPGIYQGFVKKKRELRITAMGCSLHAVEIVTLNPENGDVDWRNHGFDVKLIPCMVPDDLAAKCRALMHKMDLLFGCLDVIEGLDGEYYFLEVNQMGQFLWIEMLNPELTYLDHFIDFLYETAGKSRPAGTPFRLADIRSTPEYATMAERIVSSGAA